MTKQNGLNVLGQPTLGEGQDLLWDAVVVGYSLTDVASQSALAALETGQLSLDPPLPFLTGLDGA